MTEKWDDPQLDAAQFAIDRFLNATVENCGGQSRLGLKAKGK
jgi:hypothetical protein